jgi:hypothetical protein
MDGNGIPISQIVLVDREQLLIKIIFRSLVMPRLDCLFHRIAAVPGPVCPRSSLEDFERRSGRVWDFL